VLFLIAVGVVTAFVLRRKRRSKGAIGGGGPIETGPTELPGTYQERTAYQEIGSHKPEAFQHEVDGHARVPMAELADVTYP
jgi:hypothetical protein